jgi:hypothetical protein
MSIQNSKDRARERAMLYARPECQHYNEENQVGFFKKFLPKKKINWQQKYEYQKERADTLERDYDNIVAKMTRILEECRR